MATMASSTSQPSESSVATATLQLSRQSHAQAKKTPVPVLLESFPTPPTYIPRTPAISAFPASAINPPPSRPPSLPLPPVPGPSPISEHETLLFLSTTNRSRRSSKISIASVRSTDPNNSRPNSTASNGSSSGHGHRFTPSPPSPFGFARRRKDSTASSRSARSIPGVSRTPSYAETHHRPSIAFSISEEDSDADVPVDLTRPDIDQLTSVAVSSIPLSDIDDHESVLDVVLPTASLKGRPPPSSSPTHLKANNSISSIDMRDLPADDLDDVPTTTASQAHVNVNHLHKSTTRSRSESQKQILRSRSTSPSRVPRPPAQRVPPLPTVSPAHKGGDTDKENTRSTSPDIKSILSTTRHPRKRSNSLSNASDSVRSNSRSRSRPRAKSGVERRVSGGGGGSVAGSTLKGSVSGSTRKSSGSLRELAYTKDQEGAVPWEDDSFVEDYGVPISRQFAGDEDDDGFEIDAEMEARLERELEGRGSDSDSSLDLHTPLPHLMLRHGLLSPNSKLLPHALRPASPPPPLPDNRPFSVASTSASVMTKSGVIKDERDTPKRRTRHRDGRLLRGGIGLTTGLGWSDSEDEDAPSALTRRISSLNLSRRPSAASVRSRSSAHPLSRSCSSRTVPEESDFDNHAFKPLNRDNLSKSSSQRGSKTPPSASMHKSLTQPQARVPPTSWHKRPSSGRTSTSSVGSTLSLALSLPEQSAVATRTPTSSSRMRRSASERGITGSQNQHNQQPDEVNTPSTSSTLSIPLPITPQDDISTRNVGVSDKEKILPPLPPPSLRRYPSNSHTAAGGRYSATRSSIYSNASSGSSVGRRSPSITPAALPVSQSTPTTPRPLQLPKGQQRARPPPNGDRPAVPVPAVPSLAKGITYSQQRSVRSPSTTLSISTTPSTPKLSDASTSPTSPSATPKPRIGTGMVYRTTTGLAAGSRMRMPGSVSGMVSSKSSPRPSTVPRPIAL